MVHNLLFDLSFYCNLLILFILLLLLCGWRWNYTINKKDLKKKLHFRRNSDPMWTMRSYLIFWNICVVIMLTIILSFDSIQFLINKVNKNFIFEYKCDKNRVFVILAFKTNKYENVHRYAVWGKKLNYWREYLCLSTSLHETVSVYAQ